MSSENEQLVGRMFNELWSQGDFAMAEELFAAGYINHDPATPDYGKGPEAEKSIVRFYRKAFPDLLFTIDHMIEAGDFVTTRFTAQGTHRNEFWGVPPTNKVVKVEGTVVIRASKGRIAERWVMWDALGLLQQLGAVPGWRPGSHGGAGETA
ncbi:MAG TPA: ester cyclase [Bryobacteraceae bacterium]|nr:ester cyclase [Bryobacteraceae bacterium]